MRYLICLAMLACGTAPSLASGGLWCEADDAKVMFHIESGITRGLGNPLFNFRGELEIKDPAVAGDLRKSSFEMNNLTQHWLDASDMRLQLYRERGGDGPGGEVELVILAKAVDEATFEGSYTLTVSDMTGVTTGEAKAQEFKGKASCSAE